MAFSHFARVLKIMRMCLAFVGFLTTLGWWVSAGRLELTTLRIVG